ncbi:dipeptide ABC transporter ATP-binding protein [Segnochrobactrum spirostomi]|uniref:Dipeptide ABC transporter ATP-binding protein n=1 Tax=Segnochrobactrum spirostomi TaxID=2608987 RepID=A0A6A7Y863_9HYPH|nr:dipeptide ABC transporter ATP-binding protein [Segnochrobactrum spirostomi]MQT14178.1 dipeptide ABC transporter ATP-binding protein [Segnochrobactrum spirostomi]
MSVEAIDRTKSAAAPAAAPLVVAENLSRSYEVSRGPFRKAGLVHALAGVSFKLEAGKTLAIVGESGSGKSTLARLVTMIEEPSGGRLLIDGADVSGIDRAARARLRREVQIVFQNPYGSLNPRQTIATQLEEPLLINTDLSKAERRAEAVAMLAKVGLRPEHADRYPHMFSGGQRQRIAIARAIMLKPRILVLDEPVSALDVSVRAQVLNLLADLQEEFGLAYLFVSHDLSVVRHIADDVLVMYLGRAVEQGAADAIFESPQHPYTEALLSATPVADPDRQKTRIVLAGELPSPFNPPSGCAFNPRCWKKVERCARDRPPEMPVRGRAAACWVAAAEAAGRPVEAI